RRRGGGGGQFDPTDFAPFTPAGTALLAGAIVASVGLVWLTVVVSGVGWLLFLVPVAFLGLAGWGVHVNDQNHEQVIPFIQRKAAEGLPLSKRELHHLLYESKRYR